MKRYVHSAKDLSKKFHPSNPDADEDEMFEVGNIIDSVTYQTYDNYRYDENADYNYILDVIREHLEDPDTYGLKAGVDFDDEDIAEMMKGYDWKYINENRSVDRWIAEDLGK